MAIKGINIYETKDYVSKFDPDKKSPTVWKIGILDSLLKSKLKDIVTTYEVDPAKPDEGRAKTTLNINQSRVEIVRFGLKGFENFLDPKTGKPVKFDTISKASYGRNYNVVTDEVLKIIPENILYELADEISKESGLTAEEEKN